MKEMLSVFSSRRSAKRGTRLNAQAAENAPLQQWRWVTGEGWRCRIHISGIMSWQKMGREEFMDKASARGVRKKAQVLTSQVIYPGKVFGIRRDEVIEPSGVRATREMITHPGSVVVLPVLPDGKILLIEQYRHAAKQYLWELVAGRIDEGETPEQAAERELIEETGYRAERLEQFLEFFPTPGFLEERMFLFLAKGLTPGKPRPEDDEKIISRAYSLKQVEEMLRKRKLRDGKTIAGLLFYLRFLSEVNSCARNKS